MTSISAAAGGLVRVYRAASPNGVVLVWAHGGGFVAGDLDMPESDAVARALAEHGTSVVAVDYRLAPADDAPASAGAHARAASDDVLAAWEWARAHAGDLGATRLAIGGTSAGGNLVAGAVLRMLARGDTALPALVVLVYPTLHAVQPPTPPALRAALDAEPSADRFGPDAVRAMYERFLGGPVDAADRFAVPGLATAAHLVGFPPTFMLNSDVDELRVSGEAFAAALHEAGTPIDVALEPGTQHGHLNRPHEPGFAASISRIRHHLDALSIRSPEGIRS